VADGTDARAARSAVSPTLTMVIRARVLEARVESELKGLGLSLRRLGLLGHLKADPGISFSALARRAGIRVQSLHPIIDALMERGLVHTVGGVGQGRAAVLELTPHGHEVLGRANEVLADLDQEFFAEGDLKELENPLIRIAESFMRDRAGASLSAE
jgi:DNA-binding MarR family transcriptional regulator